ncbi:MAG: hypothetical protein ACO3KD_00775 [Gaiellales bacterium]
MSLRSVMVATGLVALAVGPGVASAQKSVPARWSAPAAITDSPVPANRISDVRVAVDETGSAVYVWRESDGARHRVRTRTCSATTCSAIEDLTDGTNSVTRLALALAADGTATAVWEYTNPSKLSARVRTGGAWTAETDVNAAGSRALQGAAAFGDGGLIVLSTAIANGRSTLAASSCASRLAICATTDVSNPANSASIPQVDANGTDKGAVAWVEQIGAGNRVVRHAPISADANGPALGTATSMSGETPSTKTRLAVDVDKTGLTTVAWVENDGSDGLYVQRFADTAPPAAPPALPAFTTTGAIADASLRIAGDELGNAVVTWATALNGAQTLSALPYASLTRGTQQAVTGDGQALLPSLAVAGTGTATLAYLRDGEVAASWAATPSGSWIVASPKATAGASAGQPTLAASRRGDIVLAWVTANQTTGEQVIRTARMTPGRSTAKPTLKVARRPNARWLVSIRITASAKGTIEQVGRITVRGRRVVACRIAPRPIAANRTLTVTCRLTRAAIRQRRAGALRIQLTTRLVAVDGQKATKRITVRLARRR